MGRKKRAKRVDYQDLIIKRTDAFCQAVQNQFAATLRANGVYFETLVRANPYCLRHAAPERDAGQAAPYEALVELRKVLNAVLKSAPQQIRCLDSPIPGETKFLVLDC